jgi:D-arabinose 1-dehydrogenase-like Zn-dependent alcohol dehydrogenase
LLVELGSKQGHPVIELFPFEDAPKAYERMMSGDARFRVVLDIATNGRRRLLQARRWA